MKATIGKKKKFITITPKPKKDVMNGLKAILSKSLTKETKPVATTDIITGRSRYYLPEELSKSIIRAEITNY